MTRPWSMGKYYPPIAVPLHGSAHSARRTRLRPSADCRQAGRRCQAQPRYFAGTGNSGTSVSRRSLLDPLAGTAGGLGAPLPPGAGASLTFGDFTLGGTICRHPVMTRARFFSMLNAGYGQFRVRSVRWRTDRARRRSFPPDGKGTLAGPLFISCGEDSPASADYFPWRSPRSPSS